MTRDFPIPRAGGLETGGLKTDDDVRYPARLPGFRGERLGPDTDHAAAVYGRPAVPLLEQRLQAVVQVIGLDRTGAALAQTLAAAGVGTILLQDDTPVSAPDLGAGAFRLSDIGLSRAAAVRRSMRQVDPQGQAHVVHPGSGFALLDLVVYVGSGAVPPAAAAALMGREQPHLVVLHQQQNGSLGPLVVPGMTACSECVRLHRAGRARPAGSWNAAVDTGSGTEASLALALAAAGARAALLFLDGVYRPACWSAVQTLRVADGLWLRKSFEPHPECGCQLQSRAAGEVPFRGFPA